LYGPSPKGHWTRHAAGEYQHLRVGRRYRVAEAFVDFDRVTHPIGETWTFLGHAYLPYDDGLSLFVSLDGEREWHIRMQLYPEEQGPIADRLEAHLVEVAS